MLKVKNVTKLPTHCRSSFSRANSCGVGICWKCPIFRLSFSNSATIVPSSDDFFSRADPWFSSKVVRKLSMVSSRFLSSRYLLALSPWWSSSSTSTCSSSFLERVMCSRISEDWRSMLVISVLCSFTWMGRIEVDATHRHSFKQKGFNFKKRKKKLLSK